MQMISESKMTEYQSGFQKLFLAKANSDGPSFETFWISEKQAETLKTVFAVFGGVPYRPKKLELPIREKWNAYFSSDFSGVSEMHSKGCFITVEDMEHVLKGMEKNGGWNVVRAVCGDKFADRIEESMVLHADDFIVHDDVGPCLAIFRSDHTQDLSFAEFYPKLLDPISETGLAITELYDPHLTVLHIAEEEVNWFFGKVTAWWEDRVGRCHKRGVISITEVSSMLNDEEMKMEAFFEHWVENKSFVTREEFVAHRWLAILHEIAPVYGDYIVWRYDGVSVSEEYNSGEINDVYEKCLFNYRNYPTERFLDSSIPNPFDFDSFRCELNMLIQLEKDRMEEPQSWESSHEPQLSEVN